MPIPYLKTLEVIMITITPIISIFCGIVFAILLAIPITFGIRVTLGDFASFLVYTVVGFAIASWITLMGGRGIDIAHRGVLSFLGKRVGGILFHEGAHWVPPFVCSLVEVSVKEYTTDIPATKFVSKNKVEMHADASIQWRIVDPFLVLNLGGEDKSGEGVIEDGLKLLILHFLRSDGKNLTDEELMEDKEDGDGRNIAKRIFEMLKPPSGSPPSIEDEANIEDRWGIVILNVLVSNLLPVDEKILDAYEKSRIEEQEKVAERTESDFFIERVNTISEKAKITPELAAAFFSTERGKDTPYRKFDVTGGGTPLVLVGNQLPKGGAE